MLSYQVSYLNAQYAWKRSFRPTTFQFCPTVYIASTRVSSNSLVKIYGNIQIELTHFIRVLRALARRRQMG